MPIWASALWRSFTPVLARIIPAHLPSFEVYSVNLPNRTKLLSLLVLLPVVFAFLAGCSSTSASSQTDLALASMDGMPAEVKSAPTTVQQAYQFAVANPDVLKHIPCYCGCGAMGHTSNYSCYVSSVDANGNVTYDSHALGCSLCVDITQDSIRLLRQGKSVSEIKTFIDQSYSQYGPSNIP